MQKNNVTNQSAINKIVCINIQIKNYLFIITSWIKSKVISNKGFKIATIIKLRSTNNNLINQATDKLLVKWK